MEELNRKIRGDWYELREAAEDIHKLEDMFSLSYRETEALSSDLRLSVEQGITEYKSRLLSALYSFLESLQYDSKGVESLLKRARDFSSLVYVVLIQRLISAGTIEVRRPKHEGLDESNAPSESVKEIMADIQQRIAKDESVRLHPAVKNIFMQISIYKRELAEMKRLAPGILPEKLKSFYANFKRTFNRITEKIRENYHIITLEDTQQAAKELRPQNPLLRHDLAPLSKFLFEQAREFSIIRSTLAFAGAERYKTREILQVVVERRERASLMISTENREYKGLEPDDNGRALSRAFVNELIRVLGRQLSRMA